MAETQPMMLQELCYTAADFRLQLGSLVCGEGVADIMDGSLLVTTGGAGLDLSVAEGAGFVNSDSADQGIYSIYNDGPVTVTATTADGTNPRIDQVIATVNDSQISGTDDDWVLSVLAGTPTGGANLTNLNGATALPDRSIRLAYVLVPASFAGPFVNATHIRDARTAYLSCGESEVPATEWSRVTNQSIANNSLTTITYPVAATGSTVPNTYYSEASGVVTFAQAGVYSIGANVVWAALANSNELLLGLLSGGSFITQSALPSINSGSLGTAQSVHVTVAVAAGATVEVQVRQQSGGAARNVTGASLRITRLGSLA